MILSETTTSERTELRSHLQDIADEQFEVSAISRALSRAIHESDITTEQKTKGLRFIRAWTQYNHNNPFNSNDPFAIRYHVTRFAAQELGEIVNSEPLIAVNLSEVTHNGVTYGDLIAQHTLPAILNDPDIAIVGGAARLGLKMMAGVDIKAELPVNDIDAVISTNTPSVSAKAKQYGVDLSGAKIVDGDIRSSLDSLVTNFDCTINQAAVYQGKLFYTERSLTDIQEGNIRLIAKNDPLFGSEGVVLPDGNVYINRVGFYRGLSFLLRGKGQRLIVSEENIEREKASIGRYWQILLFVKLMPMKDDIARYNAIGHWHELASRLGVTETPHPEAFLAELMEAYPETHAGNKRQFNAENQARWIISRLINEAASRLYEEEEFIPPDTYTESNLSLADSFTDYDYQSFLAAAQSARQ